MAESIRPLNFSGGKVIGTRRMVEAICRWPRICQKVRLLRRISTMGRPKGMRYRPSLRILEGSVTREEERYGMYELKLRFRKSNMAWRAGLTPVANVDQATGESAGKVVRRRLKPPCSRRRLRLGSLPSFM